MQYNAPRYIQNIQAKIEERLKCLKQTNKDLLETKQEYLDDVFEIYQDALNDVIDKTVACSGILKNIKKAYEDAISIRDERISQFITQDRVFGITARKKKWDAMVKKFTEKNHELKNENLKLILENARLKKDMGKPKDEQFSDYLCLMRERDARYTLYFENVSLHLRLQELDGTRAASDSTGDPLVLRIALDRCREQLSATQTELTKMKEDYSETVPWREFDALESRHDAQVERIRALSTDHEVLQNAYKRMAAFKKSTEEELMESKDRCTELERSGTPRPRWEICGDFIGGGRDRWWQLASGLSSRDMLRVLLKELGPAAESEHLEYFDGLVSRLTPRHFDRLQNGGGNRHIFEGTDPVIPPYLRYEGKVRNLRLSRREVSVIINDIWLGKQQAAEDMSMQDYVTKYFEDRYQQTSVRAEWAYNLCAGAEQMLDEPQVKLFWGVLLGQLSERIYWAHRRQWCALRDALYTHCGDREDGGAHYNTLTQTISLEEFEKVARATFPLKSEVDVKNLSDVVKKQLKLKLNNTEVNLDKLFYENEEGFDRVEFARELYRQRQLAQDKYLRELVAELGSARGRLPTRPIGVDALKRAFAIVDPAIDHIRMERYIRWAFSDQTSEMSSISPLPLRTLAARLATGDIERVGPRNKGARKYKMGINN